MTHKLTFLFDGGCPLCLKETKFLKKRDKSNLINFVDINNKYNPKNFKNISYKQAMSNLHGITSTGEIILGVEVLAYSYELIGLGWIYYPTKLPLFSSFIKLIYKYWAKFRLKLTGRDNIEILCETNCGID
tara:strand:+ start:1683 stop:2075 length:393 start_codon:yes stop_codon:yes gene_type:complete